MPDPLQVLDESGQIRKGSEPDLSDSDLVRMHEGMLRIRLLDARMLLLQRQGRIGFYGTATGEEAAVVGTAAALDPSDWVFPALRQGGILLWRGWPLSKWLANLFGSADDVSLGRSMPCHYSDREKHVVTWSSSMATQLPHAVGAAYAMKLRGDSAIAVGYLGDGASSEGDFHAAMNFAGVWKVPCVFVCHNNQWAISVPFAKQTASDGVAVKAEAYGFPGIRVDGNDVLAVHAATRAAVERARRGEGPTLIEAVTYRMLGHSSSDDPTRYRDADEVARWERRDPIARYSTYLRARGIWDDAKDAQARAGIEAEITAAIAEAERAPVPDRRTLVETVYKDVPWHLEAQFADFREAKGER